MDIVLLHHAAPPIVGGVESVMREHARLMADAGHRVRIIAGRGEQVDERIAFESLPILDSQHEEVMAIKSQLDAGQVPQTFEMLTARIEEELKQLLPGADWLVAHNVCSLNKNLPLTAALRRIAQTGKAPRLILWHHDLAWTTPRYRSELHDGYPWDLLRTDWPEVIQVVVSEWRRIELAQLLGVPAARIRVIPNGVEPARFLGLGAQTQALVETFRLMEAAPLILLPARITPRKNIEMALGVFAALRQRFQNGQLLVTGPVGPHNPANAEYYAGLLALRRELGLELSAHFLTASSGKSLPDDVVAQLYRMADVLLLPSTEEGFGIPILEAGLAGASVFCSDIDPLLELGRSDVQYFPPRGNAADVATRMAAALDASSRYALRQRVLQSYTWDRIYSTHLAPLLEGR